MDCSRSEEVKVAKGKAVLNKARALSKNDKHDPEKLKEVLQDIKCSEEVLQGMEDYRSRQEVVELLQYLEATRKFLSDFSTSETARDESIYVRF